jgi:adrenodoxin-NADP+ reductase
LKHGPSTLKIDIFEKLPVPYGLVRYGVAPDHPEVKNVIHKFDSVLAHDKVRFFGGIGLGTTEETHVSLNVHQLQKAYNAVVLAYGASKDKALRIPGEAETRNVFSSLAFVGWYNSHPEYIHLQPDLSSESAAIIGQGNVALDVARILLAPVGMLEQTDMAEHALHLLRHRNKVKHVHVIGRRGPLQVLIRFSYSINFKYLFYSFDLGRIYLKGIEGTGKITESKDKCGHRLSFERAAG